MDFGNYPKPLSKTENTMKDHLREAKLLRQKIRYAHAREEARKLNLTTKSYLRLRREVLSATRGKQNARISVLITS